MDLDDILRLIALFAFVIVPIFRTIARRARGSGPRTAPQNPRRQPPPQTSGPVVAGPVVTVPTSTVPTSTTTTTTLSGDFEKKLAEARRKVQEAMQQQGGLIKPEASRDVGQESAGGMFQTNKPTASNKSTVANKPTLPKEMHGFPVPKELHSSTIPAEFHQKATIVGGSIPETSHTSLTVAQSLQKTTLKRPKQAKLNKQLLLGKDMLSGQELTRGLLWQQILSEPRSKQKRRALSQHR